MKNNIFVASLVAVTMAGANAAGEVRASVTDATASDPLAEKEVQQQSAQGKLASAKSLVANNWGKLLIGTGITVYFGGSALITKKGWHKNLLKGWLGTITSPANRWVELPIAGVIAALWYGTDKSIKAKTDKIEQLETDAQDSTRRDIEESNGLDMVRYVKESADQVQTRQEKAKADLLAALRLKDDADDTAIGAAFNGRGKTANDKKAFLDGWTRN